MRSLFACAYQIDISPSGLTTTTQLLLVFPPRSLANSRADSLIISKFFNLGMGHHSRSV